MPAQLVAALKRRESTAFEQLIAQHGGMLYRVALRLMGQPEEAEDVLQEVFVRVWTRADTYDGRLGAPGAWLSRMARNRAIDHARDLVTMLIKAEPGARYPSHRLSTAEECYVIRGSVVIDGRTLYPGDFHHADADSDHGEITTVDGAEVLIVGSIDD